MTKDVISLSISVLLQLWHYISHKITFGAPSSGGVLCSACGAFICFTLYSEFSLILYKTMQNIPDAEKKLFTLSMGTALCCEVFVSQQFWSTLI